MLFSLRSAIEQSSCKHTKYPAKIHRKIIYSHGQPWDGFLVSFWAGFFWVGSFLFLCIEIHVPSFQLAIVSREKEEERILSVGIWLPRL